MSPEMRAFVRAGYHRLACTPYAPILDGPKKGRLAWREDLLTAYGSDDCVCHRLTIRVNGEPI